MKKEKLTIVKIGGKIIDDHNKQNRTLENFSRLAGKKILVHGGGNIASEILLRLGIKPKMHEGRRITDAETLQVTQMVYGGLINTTIVAKLQALGCNAIGMTGADANTILVRKRPVNGIDYGFVGDVDQVNVEALNSIMEYALPVFCALTHDKKGQIYNTNADTIASELAKAFAEIYTVDLVFCFEMKGVLLDREDEATLIHEINESSYAGYKMNHIITEGMIPKMDTAFNALRHGVNKVFITHYAALHQESKNWGTQISLK